MTTQGLPHLRTVGLVYNSRVDAARPVADAITAWLTEHHIQSWCCPWHQHTALLGPADLLITLGGDGTILRTMQHAAPHNIPLLGINMGRVGFLTEASPDAWPVALQRILAGEGWIEARTMLHVLHLRGQNTHTETHAVNDAVISRGALARTVHLETHIDGAFLARYVADGLILATATGSTAYAYAAGGPILPPWLDNILLVPAAPHLSLDRSVVLDASARVEVVVNTRMPGMLTVDGRMEGELLHGDIVRIEHSPLKARFLRLRSRTDFYNSLVARLAPRNGD